MPQVDWDIAENTAADVIVVDQRSLAHQIGAETVDLEAEVLDRLTVLQYSQAPLLPFEILLFLEPR